MASETKTKGDELLDEILESARGRTPEKEADSEEDVERVEERKPPREGICRRCGENRPVNRLMLCYRCWVLTEIEENEGKAGRHWHAGMSHPEWCRCSLPGAHPERRSVSDN